MKGAAGIEPEALRRVELLADLPDAELEWLVSEMVSVRLEPGERLFTTGEPAETMDVYLEGAVELVRREGGREIVTLRVEAGEISARLPFSRMRVHPATATALVPTRVAQLHADRFDALTANAPRLTERLVGLMLDRTRTFTRLDAQREKLVGLGTMAAGLAHELNNPASAARRSAQELSGTLERFAALSSGLLRESLFPDHASGDGDPFAPLHEAAASTRRGAPLDPLERSDREDAIGDWLDELGISEPWERAATLVAAGFEREPLERFAAALPPQHVAGFVDWLTMETDMRHLADELTAATERISTLVGAMKSYTYMDQSEERGGVDVAKGIRDTVTILGHKLRQRGVTVIDELPELPPVLGFGSELNQVWTNLIDNAADAALEGGGTVTLRARHAAGGGARPGDPGVVIVEVADDGPGIPEHIQARIFEPFFTTKGVGEGTGMGLDIARRIVAARHRGTLQLESEPGRTRFTVRLPVAPGG